MSKDLETILDWCLNEVRKGKDIEYCLSLHPELASELKPLLLLAKDIEATPKLEPRKEAINLTLMRIGEAVSTRRKRSTLYEKIFHRPIVIRYALTKALSFALILVVVVWTMGMLSARSLPGDLLYPLKLATEHVKFTLTRNAEGKAELRLTLTGARLEELVKTVEQQGRLDESLLRKLLKEAELALYEARPVEKDRFVLFLTKLNYHTDYQKSVLEQLKPSVPVQEQIVMDQAIKVCLRRCEFIKKMMDMERSGERCREWGPGCRCKDM